jgi:acyl transferase domain-containing protein
VSLPTYPFESRPYWLDAPRPASRRATAARHAGHPLIDRTFASPLVAERFLEAELDAARHPLLADHRIDGRVAVSGSCLVSLVLGADAVMPGLTLDKGVELQDTSEGVKWKRTAG